MSKYAYYQCYKCNKAYFGGEAQCQADAGDVSYHAIHITRYITRGTTFCVFQEFDPADLVCGGCSNLSQEVCPKHGTDYLEYKCRFVNLFLGHF